MHTPGYRARILARVLKWVCQYEYSGSTILGQRAWTLNVQAGFNNCQLICVATMLGNGQGLIKHKGKKHVASKLFELLTGCKKTN